MSTKERPTLKKLFNFDAVVGRMKKDPALTREQAMGDVIVEQSEKGAPKSLNQTLAESVQATKDAEKATERAALLRETGAKIQRDWETLCDRHEQLTAAIGRACAVREQMERIAARGAFDDNLRASFDSDDQPKSIHIAVETGKAVIAAPVVAKMIAKMRAELAAHVEAMKIFASENGLPADAIEGLL